MSFYLIFSERYLTGSLIDVKNNDWRRIQLIYTGIFPKGYITRLDHMLCLRLLCYTWHGKLLWKWDLYFFRIYFLLLLHSVLMLLSSICDNTTGTEERILMLQMQGRNIRLVKKQQIFRMNDISKYPLGIKIYPFKKRQF